MHLAQALPESVSLYHDDFEWVQSIDYEHVPFRGRKFHAHGHLFRDFPLNASPSKPSEVSSGPDADGFTKVQSRRCHNKQSSAGAPKANPQAPNLPSSSNSFEILAHIPPSAPNNTGSTAVPTPMTVTKPIPDIPASSN